MEKEKPGPQPKKDYIKHLDKALWHMDERDLLQFTGTGVRLLGSVATGEKQIRGVKSGETEYFFAVPVYKKFVKEEYSSLAEFTSQQPERKTYSWENNTSKITNEDFTIWKSLQPGPDDFVDMAKAMVEVESKFEKSKERTECGNCKGKKIFTHACSCTEGGLVFTDLTDDTVPSQRTREKGVTDPQCSHCGGTGEASNPCPVCHGAGYSMKYPEIVFINNVTGQKEELQLDLPKLIAEGEIRVNTATRESVWKRKDKEVANGEIIYNVALTDFFYNRLRHLGLDPENTAAMGNGRLGELHWIMHNGTLGRNTWHKEGKKVTYSPPLDLPAKTMTAVMIKQGQEQLSRQYAWSGLYSEDLKMPRGELTKKAAEHGRVINEDLVVARSEYRFQPLPPADETFETLVNGLPPLGFSLGFGQSFIATGETGPSFYLLDKDGDPQVQLNVEYDTRIALENATLGFKKVLSRLNKSGELR